MGEGMVEGVVAGMPKGTNEGVAEGEGEQLAWQEQKAMLLQWAEFHFVYVRGVGGVA